MVLRILIATPVDSNSIIDSTALAVALHIVHFLLTSSDAPPTIGLHQASAVVLDADQPFEERRIQRHQSLAYGDSGSHKLVRSTARGALSSVILSSTSLDAIHSWVLESVFLLLKSSVSHIEPLA